MTNSNINQNLNSNSDYDILSNPHLKENPFRVPNGYFAQFEADIQKRIKEESKDITPKAPKRLLYAQLKSAFSMAAMFIIILGLGYSVMYVTNSLEKDNTTEQVAQGNEAVNIEDELTYEEISLYLGSNFTYAEEELETIPDIEINEIDKDALEEYIIDNYRSSVSILASLE